tara:strand:- start:496 stop:768 length:273 start_codon:yes stop_codon:yes gene_type:complete
MVKYSTQKVFNGGFLTPTRIRKITPEKSFPNGCTWNQERIKRNPGSFNEHKNIQKMFLYFTKPEMLGTPHGCNLYNQYLMKRSLCGVKHV